MPPRAQDRVLSTLNYQLSAFARAPWLYRMVRIQMPYGSGELREGWPSIGGERRSIDHV